MRHLCHDSSATRVISRGVPSDAGGNPPPVTIHTWLECFNKQKPHSFVKVTAPCFLQLAGFLEAAAGIEEEQAKNFQWGLRRSTLNHLMCMSYTDVAQVANAARNYEILHERDDEDTERPDKRQRSGDRHQPTSQHSSHRSHGQNNDRHGSDRRGGIPVMDGTKETEAISPTDLPILVPLDYNVSSAVPCLFIHSIYVIPCLNIRSLSVMLSRIFFSCLIRQMVNIRTDANLSAFVQSALQTLLPQIRAEIREEFRTSSGPSDSGGNPPPSALQTLLPQIRAEIREEFRTSSGPQKSGDRHQPTTQQRSHRNHSHNNDPHGSYRRGGGDNRRSSNNNYSGNNNRETGVSSLTDLPILVFSSPGVPLRANPTRFALRVDADTQESVVELLVPASSVVKLAICKRIARRTPLQ
nr:hypothetical protein [Tanacetum cinerariifolium]